LFQINNNTATMKVHLRQRKQTVKADSQTGNDQKQRKQTGKAQISLYLEIYKGTVKAPDGKIKVLRDYKYLNLYLIDKPVTPLDRQHNKETLQLANDIKSKTELEIKNGLYGFSSVTKDKVNFIEFFKAEAEKKTTQIWMATVTQLISFAGKNVSFAQVTPAFCQEFKDYLEALVKAGNNADKKQKALSANSANIYYSTFKTCLKSARDRNIIKFNPCSDIKPPKQKPVKKEYLTIDEVRKLVKADCKDETVKRAFLFSVLTGLRWSDIQKLTWSEVVKTGNGYQLVFNQKKTGGLEYMPLSEQARNMLGTAGKSDQTVFENLVYSYHISTMIEIWMAKAGIYKKITFHNARHSFAVMQLDLGTDIYTVSQLLGHSTLKSTQAYAKIVDEKKRQAANRIPDINFE